MSVIIPAYRAERFLAAALESVAGQTHYDWEVRIHEDGVYDNSAKVIDAFSAKHPGKVFHSSSVRNSGVSRTRNQLMDAAQGDVIAFLDADDLWLPEHLERALAAIERNNADWYVSAMREVDAQGQATGPERFPPDVAPNEMAASLLSHNFIPTSLAVFGPRVVHSNFRFDPNLKVGEDLDLWIRLLGADLYPAKADRVTILYRRHESNTTNDPVRFAEEFAKVFEKHLGNPNLPSGACLRGIDIMLNPVIRMTRWRAPHRALCANFRRWRARWRPAKVSSSFLKKNR
ncbi:MAG: glycosyltransferase [Verrucomicrobia bacterium]|nr:glycosyltransferase [Verrucomicrobiota bacterium]